MFDISLYEFFLAAVIALLVLGPNRLPGALRTLGLWVGRLRRSYYNVKSEIEREIGMDDVRRQLHNEQVMADVRRVEREVRALGTDAAEAVEDATAAANPSASSTRAEEPLPAPAPQIPAGADGAANSAPAATGAETPQRTGDGAA